MSRRPILLGMLTGLLLVALLAPWTGAALGRLAKARAARAAAAAAAAAPRSDAPVLKPELAFPRASAAAAIRARIERLAHGGGVLVEAITPTTAPAPLVMMEVRVSGPEKAVLAFADAIERERPLLRFRTWRVEAAEGGGVRLSGALVGAVR
ncbi:hypothetical protein CA233_00480 [Sphingomonas sp. ABOLD]|uniref:Putative lipid-binding transport protein (Tim44 family) n=1 Tax=Sphingomonas trueperi TaxID=53317 RepID=A0A7X5XYF6_9SPHN|nr:MULTISPECIES: hypothetical protein [Sphingomonas]NJB97687.1 putative lipid-binding transport protein (Tim44 family) [Sphingomonas trueperi]RSV43504.1 hypothetical protein CA234_04685 [Sphingomonas sp. ABOLE]RSV52887.1 hypothetical protein CA233_00480 [Sphingomonas sp. ABOLD]